jgi:predicted DNA binding protein
LGAVARVASVARDVNQALDRLDGRQELEQFVCDRFVDGTGFDLAWVGRIDAVSDTLTPVTSAGGATEYLDEIRVDVGGADPDDPVARAIRTESIQVVRDVESAAEAPWRAVALDHGLEACVAIPITYGETLYGALTVYAGEGAAVDGTVRPMLSQFDTVLGHSVAAAGRRLALTSDRYVELTFDVPSSFLARAANAADGTVSLSGRISPTEETTLRYLSVTGDAAAAASAAAEYGESARVVSDDPDGVVEIRNRGETVGQRLASHGLVVDEYTADGQGATLTVRHPTEMETHTAVEAVIAPLPSASLRAKQEVSADPPERERSTLSAALTDRQRTALETAYYAGYFEWPRGTTAEELADVMDVAGPTFHQHLRAAHRNLLDRLVE